MDRVCDEKRSRGLRYCDNAGASTRGGSGHLSIWRTEDGDKCEKFAQHRKARRGFNREINGPGACGLGTLKLLNLRSP